jgi:hypothetical protein
MFQKEADASRPGLPVLKALAAFVFVLLAAGVYALASGETAPAASPGGPGASSFGFALAAGAVALAATILMSRPKLRFRR